MRENEKTIGERIRDQRLKKGFTQDYLANELHVSSQAISKWETGQTAPDITLLIPLSKMLEISVNELLGGDRRKAFEEEWQKSLSLGEEITLLIAEEALNEFPDDKTFLYRRACDEYFLGIRDGRNHHLSCAAAHFEALKRRFPDNDVYKRMLAQVYFAQGQKEKALALAYSCEDNSGLIESFSEGDDKLRMMQSKMKSAVSDLYIKLIDYNTHESIKAASGLLDVMMCEDKIISVKDRWRMCVKDALLYFDEENYEAYAEKLNEAYELAKAYDELPKESKKYSSPLFDRLSADTEYEPLKQREDLFGWILSDKKLCHAASADLRRRMAEEILWYGELHKFWWRDYYNFCRNLICDDFVTNFSTSWHFSPEELHNKLNSLKYLSHGHERMRRMYKDEVEDLITSGVMRGYIAKISDTICAFCHCGPKESFKQVAFISQIEDPPSTDASKILSIVDILVPSGLKGCGTEEKLLSLALKEAKELGFTHAEIYPAERMIIHREEKRYFFDNLELYKKLGFESVGEIFIEEGIPHIMMKFEF
jgi:transcriptional regulator with XRE-family HTH domain/predicted GNAT family N-acyltransferase